MSKLLSDSLGRVGCCKEGTGHCEHSALLYITAIIRNSIRSLTAIKVHFNAYLRRTHKGVVHFPMSSVTTTHAPQRTWLSSYIEGCEHPAWDCIRDVEISNVIRLSAGAQGTSPTLSQPDFHCL